MGGYHRRGYLPDASITFRQHNAAKAVNATYLLDNKRPLGEFAINYPPFRERVLQIINTRGAILACRRSTGRWRPWVRARYAPAQPTRR